MLTNQQLITYNQWKRT